MHVSDEQKQQGAYFIRARESGRIKIGYSADAGARLRQLQTGSGEALELMRVLAGPPELERALHLVLAAERRTGEWFEPSSRLLAYVAGTDWHVFEADVAPRSWNRDGQGADIPQGHAFALQQQGEIDFVTLYRYAYDCFGFGFEAYGYCLNAWREKHEGGRLGRRTWCCLLCDNDGPQGHGDDCPLLEKLKWLPPADRARAFALLSVQLDDPGEYTRCSVAALCSCCARPMRD